jgi:hypothetical protein
MHWIPAFAGMTALELRAVSCVGMAAMLSCKGWIPAWRRDDGTTVYVPSLLDTRRCQLLLGSSAHPLRRSRMKKAVVTLGAIAVALTAVAVAQIKRTPAPKGAEAYIISPKDGDTVTSPVTVVFGLKNMGVVPAGLAFEGAGHHHLLIDTDLARFDEPIPADDKHIHFGKGQTEATIELTPGKHTLQLVVGDMLHVPHDPPVMSKKITITVK